MNLQHDPPLGYPKTVIENVSDIISVDGYQAVTRVNTGTVGSRAAYNSRYLDRFGHPPFRRSIGAQPQKRKNKTKKTGHHAAHAPDFATKVPRSLWGAYGITQRQP